MSKEYKDYEDSKRRVNEARRIMDIIDFDAIKPNERSFIFKIERQLKSDFASISEREIFWLRDIKDRQL